MVKLAMFFKCIPEGNLPDTVLQTKFISK